MTFNAWTFLFEVLNFVVLAFVLHRLLYRPIRSAIEERKAANEHARAGAETALAEAEATRAQLAEKLAETDRDRQEVLRRAAERAEAESARRLAQAEAEAAEVLKQAEHEGESVRQEGMGQLAHDFGELAVDIAERILTQAAGASLQQLLIRRLVESLHGVIGDDRDHLRQEVQHSGVVVESAKPVDEESRAILDSSVRELLNTDTEFTYKVNPDLVCGALVRIGGHVWDATVAAQLEAVKLVLKEADGGTDRGEHP